MAETLDAKKYGKDSLPTLNDCDNDVMVENVYCVIPCNSNSVFDDCTLNSTKSLTSDNTSCDNLDFKTSFDIDVSCNSNSDFDIDCTLNSTTSLTSDNTSCNNLDFKTSFDIDVSCNSNSDFDIDCTLNSTKSYTSDNTSCNSGSIVSKQFVSVASNSSSTLSSYNSDNHNMPVLYFDACNVNNIIPDIHTQMGHDDYDVGTTDDSRPTNNHCSCTSNVISLHDYDSYDLHDTFTNVISLSDISSCSTVNKEHDALPHKNGISFNKCVSNDDDQSSLHEYVVTSVVDKCDIDIERPVIVSDNVSHVNDNHDIDSCIPSIPSIDCDDSVANSLLSDYDKDNNGISFNNDDTNFIHVTHSFQCSLKPSNNEDHVHGQSDTKSSHGNNKAKMSHGSNLSVLYFNARSIKNKLEEFHARVC